MADRVERKAVKHEARQENIDRRIDELFGRRGLRPRYAAYIVIVVWMIVVFAFGILERIVDPKTYPTIWDAWWWAIQTVTTVGYGDNPPQQPAGKIVASFLMIGGLAFLSVVTATITSSFVARRQEKSRARGEDALTEQLTALREEIHALETQLRQARSDGDARVSPR